MMALIVAHPGVLREALSGLLSTMPEIKVVGVTHDLDSALESIKASCPSIVLWVVDELGAEHVTKAQTLETTCPQTPIVALVEDLKEARTLEGSGIDVALANEVSPSELVETVSELLRSGWIGKQSS